MKTRILITLIGFSGMFFASQADAMCAVNEDWPQAPCLDTPPYTIEEKKQAWSPYYNYKGSEWMEEKKLEMITALENGNFPKWVSQPDDYSHWNVYEYYSIFEGIDYETYKPITTFSIIEKQVKYVIPYEITNGIIDDMKLNCEPPSLVLSVSSSDAGILKIDFPRKMIGGIFNVLVNEKEWTDEDQTSLDGNILTVAFPDNTHTIEVMGSYQISSNNDGVCDVVHNPPYSYILSPLKQYNSGIRYNEIICKDGLELIGKSTNGTPACVKPQSVEKLVQRWWATTDRTYDLVNPQTYSITKNEKTFQIQYSLKGAKLSEIVYDDDANSIHVILDDTIGGSLVISIPRDLIDATFSNEYDDFFVLINGQEFNYGENSNETERTLTILLPRDAHDIEIIASYLI